MKGVWNGEGRERTASTQNVTTLERTDAGKLRDAITATVQMGAALMFSGTRDGGAVVLTLLDGDNRRKVYPTDVAELDAALTDLIESFGYSRKSK